MGTIKLSDKQIEEIKNNIGEAITAYTKGMENSRKKRKVWERWRNVCKRREEENANAAYERVRQYLREVIENPENNSKKKSTKFPMATFFETPAEVFKGIILSVGDEYLKVLECRKRIVLPNAENENDNESVDLDDDNGNDEEFEMPVDDRTQSYLFKVALQSTGVQIQGSLLDDLCYKTIQYSKGVEEGEFGGMLRVLRAHKSLFNSASVVMDGTVLQNRLAKCEEDVYSCQESISDLTEEDKELLDKLIEKLAFVEELKKGLENFGSNAKRGSRLEDEDKKVEINTKKSAAEAEIKKLEEQLGDKGSLKDEYNKYKTAVDKKTK